MGSPRGASKCPSDSDDDAESDADDADGGA
jgi:hypothetical protein